MKVLLLGMNYASTLNSLVLGFKAHAIPVEGLSFEENRSSYNQFDEITCIFPNKPLSYFAYKWKTLTGLIRLYRSVKKADVIHVYSNLVLPTRLEGKLLKFLFLKAAKNKKKFITYVGSEVRIPEIEFENNPYYKEAYSTPGYEYPYESRVLSHASQKKFADLGFELICTPDTAEYIHPDYFRVDKITFHAGVAAQHPDSNPAPGEVLVIHAPTAPIAKGSRTIRAVMEKIAKDEPNITFRELQNLSNAEYQELTGTCALYIDQVIWGFHGVAAIQAMALKKPVVCFIKPALESYLAPVLLMFVVGNLLNSFHYDFSESVAFILLISALGYSSKNA